jgi:hypothetical protein
MLSRLTAAALCLAASSAFAAGHPKIKSIAFTNNNDGTFSAAITGANFGAAPAGIPCTACSPLQLQVVNLASQPAQESINVTAWSNAAISVTGIQAAPGDAVRVAVYNDNELAGSVAAWGGPITSGKHLPKIKSISVDLTGVTPRIVIVGKGFGAAPSEVGQTADSPFLVVSDFSAANPAPSDFPWNGGFCGQNDCNEVTVTFTSWTDTKVVLGGFGSSYGTNGWVISPLDALCVGIWNSASTSNGTTGGNTSCTKVP